MWFWRKRTVSVDNPTLSTPADAVQTLSRQSERCPDSQNEARTTFSRMADKYERLTPKDASVGAFLEWLNELGEGSYSWEQRELYGDYEDICLLMRAEPIAWKWFGEALDRHGCHRWRAECVTDDGRRRRPMFVRIPEKITPVAVEQPPRLRGQGHMLRLVPSPSSRVPAHRKVAPVFAA